MVWPTRHCSRSFLGPHYITIRNSFPLFLSSFPPRRHSFVSSHPFNENLSLVSVSDDNDTIIVRVGILICSCQSSLLVHSSYHKVHFLSLSLEAVARFTRRKERKNKGIFIHSFSRENNKQKHPIHHDGSSFQGCHVRRR